MYCCFIKEFLAYPSNDWNISEHTIHHVGYDCNVIAHLWYQYTECKCNKPEIRMLADLSPPINVGGLLMAGLITEKLVTL